MEHSDSLANLAAALAAAQTDCKNPPLDGKNPHFSSRFATLAAVREHVLPVFGRHKLAVAQVLDSDGERPVLRTVLLHVSGEWLAGAYPLVPVKADPQGYGSAITYARRYALQSLAGVVGDDDDDGNAASAGPARASGGAPARPLADDPHTELDTMAEEEERARQAFADCEDNAEPAAPPKCPKCGAEMKRRKSSRGEFWGCTAYPECRGTRKID